MAVTVVTVVTVVTEVEPHLPVGVLLLPMGVMVVPEDMEAMVRLVRALLLRMAGAMAVRATLVAATGLLLVALLILVSPPLVLRISLVLLLQERVATVVPLAVVTVVVTVPPRLATMVLHAAHPNMEAGVVVAPALLKDRVDMVVVVVVARVLGMGAEERPLGVATAVALHVAVAAVALLVAAGALVDVVVAAAQVGPQSSLKMEGSSLYQTPLRSISHRERALLSSLRSLTASTMSMLRWIQRFLKVVMIVRR